MSNSISSGAHSFATPGSIVYGSGALERAKDQLAALGTKALVVTDATMARLGNLQLATDLLEDCGLGHAVYDKVNSEPLDTMVDEAGGLYVREGCDLLVALGGGSPIDTMKAVALTVASGRPVASFVGSPYAGPTPPMVAVPTTAGTGSEATQCTIITDTSRDIKMLVSGTSLIPDLAIVDPAFTMTAPASVTASTGIDALCHAIEAYTSRRAQPLSDVLALSAARRIFSNLATCVQDPGNVAAREQISLAATEAGMAFNNSSVTIVHGMSRPIGAIFHVAHGLSNALLMEECLTFAAEGAPGRFADVARFCGLSVTADDNVASQDLLRAVSALLHEVGIPTLRETRIDLTSFRDAIPKMVEDALASGSPANTIRPVTADDLRRIYERISS